MLQEASGTNVREDQTVLLQGGAEMLSLISEFSLSYSSFHGGKWVFLFFPKPYIHFNRQCSILPAIDQSRFERLLARD
jgi:hypothetical protein